MKTFELIKSKHLEKTIENRLEQIESSLKEVESRLESFNKYVNMDDAASYLGVSKSKIAELFNGKEITHTIVGGNYYVELSAIDLWILTGDTRLSEWDKDVEKEKMELSRLNAGF